MTLETILEADGPTLVKLVTSDELREWTEKYYHVTRPDRSKVKDNEQFGETESIPLSRKSKTSANQAVMNEIMNMAKELGIPISSPKPK